MSPVLTDLDLDMAEITRQFISEGLEILDAMEDAMMRLEATPSDAETLHALFRGAHTLKGNASCLGLMEMTHAAHALEDVLDELGEGTAAVDAELVTIVLKMIDGFRSAMPDVAEGRDVLPALQAENVAALRDWQRATHERVARDLAPHHAAADGDDVNARANGRALRVDIERLDEMVNLAGELAVARGRLARDLQIAGAAEAAADSFGEVDRLAMQIQELVTRIRMVRIGTVLRPFVRTVRDVAAAQGKKARLVVRGGDVEVDLSVLEHLRDPLMHMIRNALDHGIELPDVRRARGKSVEGRLTLTATHQGGSIVVELEDDGQGFDRDRILDRARELGISGADKLADRDLFRLILEPGFSTAEVVTEYSGRGVGMDVVRRNVEALRGSVDVSNRGGAVVTLRLPLTLAIIDGFSVGVGDETYILPLDDVAECIDFADATTTPRQDGLIALRGEPLPWVHLGSCLGAEVEGTPRHVVVVQTVAARIGLAVDRLDGHNETVIKPLGALFERVREFSGSAILSDGRVALVLDVPRLVEKVIARPEVMN